MRRCSFNWFKPVPGAAIDQEVTHLYDDATQQRRVDRYLELHRGARQMGQRIAQPLALGVVDLLGRADPGHPPTPSPRRLDDDGVEGGDNVPGPTAPDGIGGQARVAGSACSRSDPR